MMSKQIIKDGKTALGIELGSTRIKAILLNENRDVLASGVAEWENELSNNLWTYSLEKALEGVQNAYAQVKAQIKENFGVTLNRLGAIGISGMMHGFLVFDKKDKLLTPFRTWRNNNAENAAKELTTLFNFKIPSRWSIAHLLQAINDGEPFVKNITHLTTLAGHIHYQLTGERCLGIGEASGIFPIDLTTKNYDKSKIELFSSFIKDKTAHIDLLSILPKICLAGENAGFLSEKGARLLDPQGNLQKGAKFCPPEGDTSTGMVSTNSIKPKTANISAGTSIFAMVVLEKALQRIYPQIDVVLTPTGSPVAMVHSNNCSSDINAWVAVLEELLNEYKVKESRGDLLEKLLLKSLQAEPNCGGFLSYNYVSSEHSTQIDDGCPTFLRTKESNFNLANFIRTHLYSAFATLKLGLDILSKEESVQMDSIVGHGGLFKTEGVFQSFLASALDTPVSTTSYGGEGGAWGMALLALFALQKQDGESLADYLSKKIFKNIAIKTLKPQAKDREGIEKYIEKFVQGLPALRFAVNTFKEETEKTKNSYAELKERVFVANKALVSKNLVVLTWGNASEIDRKKGVVAIKPSGVSYENMIVNDIVVVSLEGEIIEGNLNPSSDLSTHLALYKAFNDIGGVVHTHSTYATAFAQAGKSLDCFGTTHADYFYGGVPCTRALTQKEIATDYEKNTGLVIAEHFTKNNIDPLSCPAVLVKNHAPFTWGSNAQKAVENSLVLEEVAKMASLTLAIDSSVQTAPKELIEKHYHRKHGLNAYYGQKK